MAHSAWMPFYWGDYIRKTLHLTCEEHGAYVLLIGAYWERGKPLPDDDRFFASVTKLSKKKWKNMRPKIAEFFDILEGVWRHERVENELLRSSERQDSARANGRAGGLAKSKLLTITPTNTEERKIVNFNFGKGGRKGVEMTAENRLSIFHTWLAPLLGQYGWQIIGKAMDPDSLEYAACVDLCRRTAKQNGKGWPHQWPVNPIT